DLECSETLCQPGRGPFYIGGTRMLFAFEIDLDHDFDEFPGVLWGRASGSYRDDIGAPFARDADHRAKPLRDSNDMIGSALRVSHATRPQGQAKSRQHLVRGIPDMVDDGRSALARKFRLFKQVALLHDPGEERRRLKEVNL